MASKWRRGGSRCCRPCSSSSDSWRFIGSVVVMIILGRYLPKSSFFQKMELVAATTHTASTGEATALLGSTGVAETNLRPAGKGRFGEQLVDVVTEGDLIERGAKIKI